MAHEPRSRRLIGPLRVPAVFAAIGTVPADKVWRITAIRVVSTAGVTGTSLSLGINGSDGADRWLQSQNVPAGATFSDDLALVLAAGDELWAEAGTANVLTLTATGFEFHV